MSEENKELDLSAEEAQEQEKLSEQEKLPEQVKLPEQSDSEETRVNNTSKTLGIKKKLNGYQLLRISFSIGFVLFAALFINEVLITPYRINKSIEKTNQLYKAGVVSIAQVTATPTPSVAPSTEDPSIEEVASIPDPSRDNMGRLLQFQDLLALNEDVKGWITVPDTNIDYVVMQSNNGDPEYYLNRDIEKNKLKAGSLFLDYKSSVESNSQNLTIHGHNMTSTDNMFHYLVKFKELDYYKARPAFTFDTILQTGQWKIFSIFITNGGSEKEELFNYTRADFKDSGEFLNYVYQLRIRSMFHIDTVDINENDQLLTLSTCSYEVKNYRTVIVARKVREGEEPTVDVESVTINMEPLYPYSYYYRYGGKAPELTKTFEEALANGEISWYSPTISP
jgi:sortase B